MELMARYPDKYFELAIVDPPYGIGMSKGTMTHNKKINITSKRDFVSKEWDNQIPDKLFFDELFRVSKNQIIWGGNYMLQHLTNTPCFIVWDKKSNDGSDFADAELAWTSFSSAVRVFKYDWVGFGYLNNPHKERKIHPTQKPVALYKWLLNKYAKQGDKILDCFLGSGSIAIACHDYGFDLTACELDTDYYNAAMKRINNHTAQLKLF